MHLVDEKMEGRRKSDCRKNRRKDIKPEWKNNE